MFGPVSERRLALVHPTLSYLMHQLEAQLSEPIGITQGLRTAAEQKALFAQGRQSLTVVNQLRAAVGWSPLDAHDNMETVTKAGPGYSWHEFGLAVDVVPFESSGQPDWDESHPIWTEIISKGEALGLVSGVAWKDEPHFQWTCQYPETPTDEIRQLYNQGGLKAIWDSLKV